jgi:hypothetical protein
MDKLPLQLVDKVYRKQKTENPKYKNLSLKQWSQLANSISGTNLYDEGVKAGAIQRGVLAIDRPFQDKSEQAGSAIRNKLGTDFVGESLAKGAEFTIGSIPSVGGSLLAASGRTPQSRLLKSIPLAAYGLTSNYNQTADLPSAAVSGASLGLVPSVSSALVNKATTGVGKFLAGYGTGFAQDLIEVGAAPDGQGTSLPKRFVPNVKSFVSDPTNLAGMALAEAPMGLVGKVVERANQLQAERDQRVSELPGIPMDKSTKKNLMVSLREEFNIDIPKGAEMPFIINAYRTAKSGDLDMAQYKLYESAKGNLTEQQLARMGELAKPIEQQFDEFSQQVDRDFSLDAQHVDEAMFKFKDNNELQNFLNLPQLGEERNKIRTVGKNLYYWGRDTEVLAALSENKRTGKVGKFKLAPTVFDNPALGVIEKALRLRVKSDGKKVLGPKLTPNNNGAYKADAVFKELEGNIPQDILDFYKEAWYSQDPTFNGDTKEFFYGAEGVAEWFAAVTPELEIKNIAAVDDGGSKQANLLGELETLGVRRDISMDMETSFEVPYRYVSPQGWETLESVVEPGDRSPDMFLVESYEDLAYVQNDRVRTVLSEYMQTADAETNSDSASAAFTAYNPKPIKDMPGLVDVVVRQQGEEKFREPNHYPRISNVLTHVRGYFPDPKTFFAFEVQSDWGQSLRKESKKIEEVARRSGRSSAKLKNYLGPDLVKIAESFGYSPDTLVNEVKEGDFTKIYEKSISQGLPLLARYEKLALQAAIRHAKEKGATKFILPDAETAMMIERHDGYKSPVIRKFKTKEDAADYALANGITYDPTSSSLVVEASTAKRKKLEGFKLRQELGMRTHYSGPTRYSQEFKDAYKRDKGVIPKESVGTLVGTLESLGATFQRPVDLGKMTNREASTYFDGKDNITGFQFDIANVNEQAFTMYKLEKLAEGRQEKTLLDHETLSHLNDMQTEWAESGQIMSTRNFIDVVVRRAKAEGRNVDAQVATRLLARLGGLDKMVNVFRDKTSDTIGFMSTEGEVNINLDMAEHIDALTAAGHEFTHTSLLDMEQKNPEGYNRLVEQVYQMDAQMLKTLFIEANEMLGMNIDPDYAAGLSFDPNMTDVNFMVAEERLAAITEIIMQKELINKTPKFLQSLPLEVQRFVLNVIDKMRSYITGFNRYGDVFTPESQALFNDLTSKLEKQVFLSEKAAADITRIMEGSDAFDPVKFGSDAQNELKNRPVRFKLSKDVVNEVTLTERPELSTAQKTFWSTLALTKAFPIARPLFERLHNYRPNIQKTLMQYFSELGQNSDSSLNHKEALGRWESWIEGVAKDDTRLDKLGGVFEEDQKRRADGVEIMSVEEMKEAGVSDEDAEMVTKFRGLIERVAYQEFLDMSHRDYINQANFVLSQFSDKLNKEQAEGLGQMITQRSNQIGQVSSEVNKMKGSQKLNGQRMVNIRKEQLKQAIVQELNNLGVTVDVTDPRVQAVSQLAAEQSNYRFKHLRATSQEGYAPMTIRGDYILRYQIPDPNNEGEVLNMALGGRTEADAKAKWDKLKAENDSAVFVA